MTSTMLPTGANLIVSFSDTQIFYISGSFDKSSVDGRPKKSEKPSGKQMQASKLREGASKGAGLPMISEKSGTPSEVSGNE